MKTADLSFCRRRTAMQLMPKPTPEIYSITDAVNVWHSVIHIHAMQCLGRSAVSTTGCSNSSSRAAWIPTRPDRANARRRQHRCRISSTNNSNSLPARDVVAVVEQADPNPTAAQQQPARTASPGQSNAAGGSNGGSQEPKYKVCDTLQQLSITHSSPSSSTHPIHSVGTALCNAPLTKCTSSVPSMLHLVGLSG